MRVKFLETVDVNGIKYDPITIENDGISINVPGSKHFGQMEDLFDRSSPRLVSFRKHI